jgi:type II secretory ATPase GspE/PulE/Tfp pilus assembly ATPase PilB-like protein
MRLIDMGVEPYLVSSTLIGSMAQRLVRKICPKCKAEFKPSQDKLPKDFSLGREEPLYCGQGCPACRTTGFRGRSGLFELLVMDDEIAHKIMERAPSPEIVRVGRTHGLRLLREDGWLKVRQGVTTIEEVLKCTAV